MPIPFGKENSKTLRSITRTGGTDSPSSSSSTWPLSMCTEMFYLHPAALPHDRHG